MPGVALLVPEGSRLEVAASAGESLPADLHRRFTSHFGVPLLDGIGTTEALHIFCSNRLGAERPGTSGTPVDGYQSKLVDDDGAEVTAPDTPGGLLVKGESLATGYWCRTATTRQVFQGEWMRTGDTYTLTRDVILPRGIDGTFKGNRHLVFPDNQQRTSNMLLSILHLYGIEQEKIGTSTGRLSPLEIV